MANKLELAAHIPYLRRFVSTQQLSVLGDACYGEEREWFIDTLVELAERILAMSKTYEQDGKGDDAIVYLHYFKNNMDWYITEKDMEVEQIQAFGLADLGMDCAELGYISIEELTEYGAELDLHWTPKTLREVKA
jgi:hypothetical protein